MFCKRFVEVLDGGSRVSNLSVGSPNTPVGLCDELVVRPDLGMQRVGACKTLLLIPYLTAFFNRLLASLNTLLVLALFEINSYRTPQLATTIV